MSLIICGTGHRPGRAFPHDDATFVRLIDLATGWLKEHKPDVVISGMALGWDMALAKAALDLGIPVHAYLPCRGQADRWPKRSVERYVWLLERCAVKKLISKGEYADGVMQLRNEAMVDDVDLVLALWDGSPGGTKRCIDYANENGVKVENLWPEWERIQMEDI